MEGWAAPTCSGHPSLAQGCAGTDVSAPPPPPFPSHIQVFATPTMFKAGRLLCDISLGCPSGTKLASLNGLEGPWMLGGGPGGERRGVHARNLRLRCGRAAMASWGAWMRVVGGAGVSEECDHRGTSLAHSSYWPVAAASKDVISFLKALSWCPRLFMLLRVKT